MTRYDLGEDLSKLTESQRSAMQVMYESWASKSYLILNENNTFEAKLGRTNLQKGTWRLSDNIQLLYLQQDGVPTPINYQIENISSDELILTLQSEQKKTIRLSFVGTE